jgi:Flp pilus assembly protein protease CpaA
MINLLLAAVLVGVAAYTDITKMKIYNKHVGVFFLIGAVSIMVQKQYELLLSAALVLAIYLFFYTGSGILSNIAVNMGLMPLPEGAKPLGGGDVKLAVVLALFLGHLPVLYGTVAGLIMMVIWQGVKRWRYTGSPQGLAEVALGRVHAPAAFGPFLGACSLGFAASICM